MLNSLPVQVHDAIYSSHEEEDSRPVLQWAFAGTSHNTKLITKNDQSNMIEYSHSVWDHWIDSKTQIATTTDDGDKNKSAVDIDEGDCWPQPNGDILERGTQLDPISGKEREYEELWGDVEVQVQVQARLQRGDEGKRVSVVLKTDVDIHGGHRDTRGLVVRVGQYCQGIVQVGDKFTMERWEWMNPKDDEIECGFEAGPGPGPGPEGRWCCKVRIGDGSLPCDQAMNLDGVGDDAIIRCGELEWRVVENYRW